MISDESSRHYLVAVPCYMPRYYLIDRLTYDQCGVSLVYGGKIVANDINEWNVIISHASRSESKWAGWGMVTGENVLC